MLQAYFDDSGSDGQKQPYVLAGYILPAERWAAFADDWVTECARPPKINYFKFYEAVNAEGEFTLVQYDLRRFKILNLIEVMRKHQLHGLCTAFRWDDWRDFARRLRGPVKDQPYSNLFFLMIDTVIAYQKNLKIFPQKTQLDFDYQGKAGPFAMEWYGRMMQGVGPYGFGEEHRQILEGTPRWLDGKQYVPLQAADMLAGALRGRLDETLTDPVPDFRWVYDELLPDVWGGFGYDKDSGEAIRKQLPRPYLPNF